MPSPEVSLPAASVKTLRNRHIRRQRVEQLIHLTEPSAIALQLRRQRQKVFGAFCYLVDWRDPDTGALDAAGISSLNSTLLKTQELLLRLAKVPQAPPGSTGKQLLAEARKVLDAEPIEAVDLRETAGE